MSSKESMKSLHKDLPKFLKRPATHSYNLRPRCKRINYNNSNSYRSNIKGRLQTLQSDLANTSNREKANDSSVEEWDASAKMVTHFVNENFDNDSSVEDPKAEEIWLQNTKESHLQGFNKSDCTFDSGYVKYENGPKLSSSGEVNSAYTMYPADNVELEEGNEGFKGVQSKVDEIHDTYSASSVQEEFFVANGHPEQAKVSNNLKSTRSTSSNTTEENEEENVLSEQANSSNNGEDTQAASSCEAEENEENNADLDTEFQRNYSVSAFNYQELSGNPIMLHLTRWASQSRIQNSIDPVDSIRNIDTQAMGDGTHNQRTVLELHVSILNEEDGEFDGL